MLFHGFDYVVKMHQKKSVSSVSSAKKAKHALQSVMKQNNMPGLRDWLKMKKKTIAPLELVENIFQPIATNFFKIGIFVCLS